MAVFTLLMVMNTSHLTVSTQPAPPLIFYVEPSIENIKKASAFKTSLLDVLQKICSVAYIFLILFHAFYVSKIHFISYFCF